MLLQLWDNFITVHSFLHYSMKHKFFFFLMQSLTTIVFFQLFLIVLATPLSARQNHNVSPCQKVKNCKRPSKHLFVFAFRLQELSQCPTSTTPTSPRPPTHPWRPPDRGGGRARRPIRGLRLWRNSRRPRPGIGRTRWDFSLLLITYLGFVIYCVDKGFGHLV